MPELYFQMIAHYQEYAEEHGVQDMPEGYDYIKQATFYSAKLILIRNGPYFIGGLLFVFLVYFYFSRRAKHEC
jgi:hypothetical protein